MTTQQELKIARLRLKAWGTFALVVLLIVSAAMICRLARRKAVNDKNPPIAVYMSVIRTAFATNANGLHLMVERRVVYSPSLIVTSWVDCGDAIVVTNLPARDVAQPMRLEYIHHETN